MASSRFDPQPPDRSGDGGNRTRVSNVGTNAELAGAPEHLDLLGVIGKAEQMSKDYQMRTIDKSLGRSYRAWQNQHADNSKYLGTAYKGRSRLFVPKTRAAVRKNLATAAASLFSTEEVVNIAAQYEDDPQQRATAATMKANLDYRLTRASGKSGMPWYIISMGACLDGQLTGVSISKQYWEYGEVPTGRLRVEERAAIDPLTGEPIMDPMTGAPGMEQHLVPEIRVTKDRPMVELHPIENVLIDPAAPWYAPVQMGRWFACRYPMGLNDARAMIASGSKGAAGGHGVQWLEVSDETLLKGRVEEDRAGTRRVREGGGDRYEDARGTREMDIVWLQENFVRIDGMDYHFWSVGRHAFISTIRETREVYPEQDGDRPYVMGVSQLDTHRVFPQSPVETWQPLQLELNDVANLRLDTLKRSIAPLAVVKKGKNVDLTAVQRRGQPDAMVMVDQMDDFELRPTPGPTGAAFTEASVNNSLFDELSGTFSTSSVQSSRQLNETVGGMRLMSGAANAVSEFDLRMWVETWVEPVIRQLVHLIRFYESDEKVVAIAGQNARAWTRFEYMPTIEDFEACEITVRVNAGIGALDPMAKLQKLRSAFEMLTPLMGEAKGQGISIDVEAIIEEVMGAAGFRDGRRFFKFGEAPPQQMDPETIRVMEEIKLEREKSEQDFIARLLELRSEEGRNTQDNDTKIVIEQMKARGKLLDKLTTTIDQQTARREDRVANFTDHKMKRQAQVEDRDFNARIQQDETAMARKERIFQMLAGGNARPQQRLAA
jgi:hypothetical protein